MIWCTHTLYVEGAVEHLLLCIAYSWTRLGPNSVSLTCWSVTYMYRRVEYVLSAQGLGALECCWMAGARCVLRLLRHVVSAHPFSKLAVSCEYEWPAMNIYKSIFLARKLIVRLCEVLEKKCSTAKACCSSYFTVNRFFECTTSPRGYEMLLKPFVMGGPLLHCLWILCSNFCVK